VKTLAFKAHKNAGDKKMNVVLTDRANNFLRNYTDSIYVNIFGG